MHVKTYTSVDIRTNTRSHTETCPYARSDSAKEKKTGKKEYIHIPIQHIILCYLSALPSGGIYLHYLPGGLLVLTTSDKLVATPITN